MLRTEWDDRFFPDAGGRITLTGEWQGQNIYVPYLWEQALQDGIVPDEGDHDLTLMLTRSDRDLFPELGTRRFVQIKVRGGKFVGETEALNL